MYNKPSGNTNNPRCLDLQNTSKGHVTHNFLFARAMLEKEELQGSRCMLVNQLASGFMKKEILFGLLKARLKGLLGIFEGEVLRAWF